VSPAAAATATERATETWHQQFVATN